MRSKALLVLVFFLRKDLALRHVSFSQNNEDEAVDSRSDDRQVAKKCVLKFRRKKWLQIKILKNLLRDAVTTRGL